ncbi:MAG: hypothetical protein ACW99Q_09065 [Candidatus Kariarchaeaceae archaeon]|jgi:hypothetical protein
MSNLLEDPVNLKLSELLCEGTGVEVNVSELSRILNKHRNTIDDRISKLLSSNIVDPPFCHFTHLLDAFPLMVIEKADYPRDTLTNHFIETDPYIEAAYFVKVKLDNPQRHYSLVQEVLSSTKHFHQSS